MREILPRYTKGCNDCPVDKCDHCGAFDGIYKELHSLLCAEIEKMENPYPVSQRFVSSAGNLWEECRQAILDKLKEGAE